MVKTLISTAASDQLAAAAQFLTQFPAPAEVLVVSGMRATVDDFVRQYAREKRGTFGLHRFSLAQLAARISVLKLAANGLGAV
jgi:hypothetical protein